MHYQQDLLPFSLKLLFCLDPYVYLTVSNFYDPATTFSQTFNLVTSALQAFLGLLFLLLARFLLKRELRVLKTPKTKGSEVREESYAAMSMKGVSLRYGEKQVVREVGLE